MGIAFRVSLVISFLLIASISWSEDRTVIITQGNIIDLGTLDLSPYGAAIGKVRVKLGASSTIPSELWLVPQGTSMDDYKSTGKYPVMKNLGLYNDCKTSVYFNNQTGMYAFKSLSLNASDGSFCILADPGTYKLIAEI